MDGLTLCVNTDPRFEAAGGGKVHVNMEDLRQFSLQRGEPKQACPWREVHQQVDVTVGSVLAPRHAAKDPEIAGALTLGGSDQRGATLTQSSAKSGVRKPAHCGLVGLEPNGQVLTCGRDEST